MAAVAVALALHIFGAVVWVGGMFINFFFSPSPRGGEGRGEGVRTYREVVRPHPAHFVRRPLPMGEVKKSQLFPSSSP